MKRLLLLFAVCILLAGCSPKKEEEVKKTTSYTPEEVRTIFENAGFVFDLRVDEAAHATYVYIARDDVVLRHTIINEDGEIYKFNIAKYEKNLYNWSYDAANLDKCVYDFKEKKTIDDSSCSDAQIKELEKSKQSFFNLLKKLDLSTEEVEALFNRIYNENI